METETSPPARQARSGSIEMLRPWNTPPLTGSSLTGDGGCGTPIGVQCWKFNESICIEFEYWKHEQNCLQTDLTTSQTIPFNSETSMRIRSRKKEEFRSHERNNLFDHSIKQRMAETVVGGGNSWALSEACRGDPSNNHRGCKTWNTLSKDFSFKIYKICRICDNQPRYAEYIK